MSSVRVENNSWLTVCPGPGGGTVSYFWYWSGRVIQTYNLPTWQWTQISEGVGTHFPPKSLLWTFKPYVSYVKHLRIYFCSIVLNNKGIFMRLQKACMSKTKAENINKYLYIEADFYKKTFSWNLWRAGAVILFYFIFVLLYNFS